MSNKTALSVLIEADDQASKKLAQVTQNVERNVQRIKDVGGKAKASTEFIGTLASSLGGSEIGSYAGQLAGLTDKVSAFSEVSKAGGAGALAFKAGIAGLVAAGSVKVGSMLGDWAFQTKNWKEELAEAVKLSDELTAKQIKGMEARFDNTSFDVELIRNPEDKQKAYQSLLDATKTNLKGVTEQVKASEKALKDYDASWQSMWLDEGHRTNIEKQLQADKSRLTVLKQQSEELEKIAGTEAQRRVKALEAAKSEDTLENLRQQLKLTEAIGDEKLRLSLGTTVTDQDREQAVQLLKQIEDANKAIAAQKLADDTEKRLKDELELMKAQGIQAERIKFIQQGMTGEALERVVAIKEEIIEHEKLKKAEEERVKLAEKVRDAQQSELDRIRETVLARVKGEEEVHVERMKKLGIEESQARKIASLSARANKQQDDGDMPVLQAFESRTLLRATGGGWQSQFLEEQRKTRETNEAMLLELERLREDANKKNDDKTLVKLVAK